MSFQVEVRRPAEKELGRLSHDAQKRVAAALLRLAEEPFPSGFKKLKGSDGYRILHSADPTAGA